MPESQSNESRVDGTEHFSHFSHFLWDIFFLVAFVQVTYKLRRLVCRFLMLPGSVLWWRRWPGAVTRDLGADACDIGEQRAHPRWCFKLLSQRKSFDRLVYICRRRNLHVDLSFRIEEL